MGATTWRARSAILSSTPTARPATAACGAVSKRLSRPRQSSAWREPPSAPAQHTSLAACEPLNAKAVYDAAAAGDAVAQQIVADVGARLGIALRNVIMAYDVDTVVLGGGVTRAGDRYLQPILAEWARQRETSAFARAMLLPAKLRIADPSRNMGAWGAVALAARNTSFL